MTTAELIQKTRDRLAELAVEIPSAQAEWKASLLGEGDPVKLAKQTENLAKQTDKLTSEQVVEAARLEVLEDRQRDENAQAEDGAQRASAAAANIIVSEYAAWAQQLKDKAAELSAVIATAPSRDAFYSLADGAGKHLDLIEVSSIPNFFPDADALRYALEKVRYEVGGPASTVSSIRSQRMSVSMMATMQPGQGR